MFTSVVTRYRLFRICGFGRTAALMAVVLP